MTIDPVEAIVTELTRSGISRVPDTDPRLHWACVSYIKAKRAAMNATAAQLPILRKDIEEKQAQLQRLLERSAQIDSPHAQLARKAQNILGLLSSQHKRAA